MGWGNAHGLPFLCLWLGIEASQITRKIEVDESIIKMTLKDGNRYATNQYHGRVKIEWLAIATKSSSATCCYELYKRQTTYGGTWILLFNIQQVLNWCHIALHDPMECIVVFASLTSYVFLSLFTLVITKDYCHPNPCLNGGTCVQVPSGYDCHCDIQYTGAHCEGEGLVFMALFGFEIYWSVSFWIRFD